MHSLSAIVYVSSAARLMSHLDLASLLAGARSRNAIEEVTGLLLYCEGNFMQYLEGPPGPLQYVYSRIRCDARHHSVHELTQEPVPIRLFDSWSMAFSHAHQSHFNRLMTAAWRTHAQSDKTTVPGRELLLQFWHEQMSLRPPRAVI